MYDPITIDLDQPNAINTSPDCGNRTIDNSAHDRSPLDEPEQQGQVHTGSDGHHGVTPDQLGQESSHQGANCICDPKAHHGVSNV